MVRLTAAPVNLTALAAAHPELPYGEWLFLAGEAEALEGGQAIVVGDDGGVAFQIDNAGDQVHESDSDFAEYLAANLHRPVAIVGAAGTRVWP